MYEYKSLTKLTKMKYLHDCVESAMIVVVRRFCVYLERRHKIEANTTHVNSMLYKCNRRAGASQINTPWHVFI